MKHVVFDYETNDGRILEIEGNTDGRSVYFKARDLEGNQVRKNTLTTVDFRNIEELIEDTADEIFELNDTDYYGEDL